MLDHSKNNSTIAIIYDRMPVLHHDYGQITRIIHLPHSLKQRQELPTFVDILYRPANDSIILSPNFSIGKWISGIF